MKKLSVVINTKNAAETLHQTLASVKFADEVVVADMESSDETVKIAQQFGAKIVHITDYGRVEPEARNEANAQATCEWTIQVDADEVIPQLLQDKIVELISSSTQATGFNLPRKNIIFGQWIQHTGWWPDYQLRLFKTGSLQWKKGVHSKPSLHGQVENLPSSEELAIIHANYATVTDFITRLNTYTTLQANEGDSNLEGSSYVSMVSGEFCRRFFHLQGWKDGEVGLALSLLQSLSQVVVRAKISEAHGQLTTQSTPLPEKELRQLTSDIQYWLADYHVRHSPSGFTKLYWQMRRKVKR